MNKTFFILAFLLFSCSEKTEKISPQIESITESVYASGILKSENQYQVFARSSGILSQVFVQEGDLVNTHQLLFSIYNETSSLSRENAQLLASFNALSNNEDKLDDLRSSIELAKNRLKTDSLNYQRLKSLSEKNLVSNTEMEQAELMYLNSKTAYHSAKIRYSDLKKQLNFSDQQSKRNLKISQTLENDFVVKSEIKGKVYAILKEKGEMVSPQVPLAVIGDASSYIIELQIDENDITKIEKNQSVVLFLDSYQDQTFEAYITNVKPFLNERSRTFIVEAKFKKQPPKLFPNLSLEANIIIGQKKKALLIPRSCLVDENYVLLESGQKVKVQIGLKNLEKVEILGGITEKDVIIAPEK